jgi:hypothetical protein
VGWVGFVVTGCGPDSTSSSQGGSDTAAVQTYAANSSQRQADSGTSSRQAQADFLNRIRQADPSYQTIQKSVLNENNELGLILGRSVQLDSIPALMRSMLTRMGQEFPNQNLTIVAYAPSQPPARIGAAHLDARTRQMTYTPEHRNNQ